MRGVRSVTHSTQAIEGRNPQARCEIAVGTPADRGFAEFPSQITRNGSCLRIERRYCRAPLHRRTIDASADLNLALAVERTQGAHLLVDPRRVFQTGDTNIHLRHRFGRYHVRSRPATHDPDIHRQSFFQIGEAGNSFDLMRQLTNSVHAFFEIEASVRSLACNFDEIFADSFARSFHRSMRSIRWLKHEHGGGSFCQRLSNRTRRLAPD